MWLGQERSIYFPNIHAAKVLALCLCFPSSASHPDWDLGIKLSGREAGPRTSLCWHGQQRREHHFAVRVLLIRWLTADGSSVFDQDRHDEFGGWELLLENQQSLLLQSFQ